MRVYLCVKREVNEGGEAKLGFVKVFRSENRGDMELEKSYETEIEKKRKGGGKRGLFVSLSRVYLFYL